MRGRGDAGGRGGFSERSSATSIGAACGRLFRLRKTAMLSRHWRLWLSFPALALPPEERLGIGLCVLSDLCARVSWARFLAAWLWSRRLTEPPRPCGVGERTPPPASRAPPLSGEAWLRSVKGSHERELRLSKNSGELERAAALSNFQSCPAACTVGTGRFFRRKIPFSREKIVSLQFLRPEIS